MKKHKTQFDPDFSPNHETNKDAAKERNLTYDRFSKVYRDSDGCPVLDRFGQSLG